MIVTNCAIRQLAGPDPLALADPDTVSMSGDEDPVPTARR